MFYSTNEYDYYGPKDEPTDQQRAADLAALQDFKARAELIKKRVEEMTILFGDEFFAYAQKNLTPYEYDYAINNAVRDVMDTAGIYEYHHDGHWLPSNIGC